MERDIFKERKEYKPFEYKELEDFVSSIHKSFWIVDEFNTSSDVQEFKTQLSKVEQEIIKRTLLAISQIEVSVKKFWARIGDDLPKPEIYDVGFAFADSEVRHAQAYSKLLEVLGFNEAFQNLMTTEAMAGRINYLDKYLSKNSENRQQYFVYRLALFALFVENVSLFSQFAIMESFKKHKNLLKAVSNIVEATKSEETVHFLFGVKLINLIKEEHPSWFGADFYEFINKACKKAYKAESKILEWIFENGELSFLSKDSLDNFIKDRFNESIEAIGGSSLFTVDNNKLASLQWFKDEISGYIRNDFFNTQSTNYSKKTASITEDDLF